MEWRHVDCVQLSPEELADLEGFNLLDESTIESILQEPATENVAPQAAPIRKLVKFQVPDAAASKPAATQVVVELPGGQKVRVAVPPNTAPGTKLQATVEVPA